MKINKVILFIGALLVANSGISLAIDKKFMEGSEKIEPNRAALEFASRYTHAINTHSTKEYVALFAPTSRACYEKSQHPEYYQTEFKGWFDFQIDALSEWRHYKTTFEFHQLMGYPEPPTDIAIFKGGAMMRSGRGVGFQSTEVIEKNGKYYISYRCM
jgi:hypothetical protein